MPEIPILAGKEIPAKKAACLSCIEKEPLDMHDLKTTHTELENILKSKEFRNAEKYIDLLKFLLDMTEKGIIPKEKDIARAALQKGADFDPLIDTSVRVYMYRLRKKLEDYYRNEGRKNKIQLVIPKLKMDINAELNAIPRYFEIVYEVQGFAKTSMYSNLMRCYPIPDNYSISRL